MLKAKIIKNLSPNYIYWLLLVLTLMMFDAIVSFFVFPLTEGWWEVYARIFNVNSNFYEQYYAAFPPLFIFIISKLQNISQQFDFLRLCFIVLHLIEFVSLYVVAKQFTDKNWALLAAFFAESLMIVDNPVYLTKDYHIIVSLLVNFSAVGLLLNCQSLLVYRLIGIIFSGISIGALFLIKQNIAAFSSLAVLLILFYSCGRNRFYSISLFVLACILPVYAFTFFYGFGWTQAYIGNDSKGSLFTVLTRFILDKNVNTVTLLSLVFYFLHYYKSIIKRTFEKLSTKINNKYYNWLYNINFHVYFTVSLFFVYFGPVTVLFSIVTAFVLNWVVNFFKNPSVTHHNIISVYLLTLIYCGTMTAGFNAVSMELPIAVVIASIFFHFRDRLKYAISFTLVLLMSLTCFISNKFFTAGYGWWGYELPGIPQNIYKVDNRLMSSIHLDFNTSKILEDVRSVLGDDKPRFLAYPSIPLLYYLYTDEQDLDRVFKYPVAWFDVIPSSKSDDFINNFYAYDPEYIFWLKPPFGVYEGHSKMRKKRSVISVFDSELFKLISDGRYDIIYSYPVIKEDAKTSYLIERMDPVEFDIFCPKCTPAFLSKYVINGTLIDHEYKYYDHNILTVKATNKYVLNNFLQESKSYIINSPYYMFLMLKKVGIK